MRTGRQANRGEAGWGWGKWDNIHTSAVRAATVRSLMWAAPTPGLAAWRRSQHSRTAPCTPMCIQTRKEAARNVQAVGEEGECGVLFVWGQEGMCQPTVSSGAANLKGTSAMTGLMYKTKYYTILLQITIQDKTNNIILFYCITLKNRRSD